MHSSHWLILHSSHTHTHTHIQTAVRTGMQCTTTQCSLMLEKLGLFMVLWIFLFCGDWRVQNTLHQCNLLYILIINAVCLLLNSSPLLHNAGDCIPRIVLHRFREEQCISVMLYDCKEKKKKNTESVSSQTSNKMGRCTYFESHEKKGHSEHH